MSQQRDQRLINPAEAYESSFVPALSTPWAEDLLRRSAPQPGERFLDVACGTGIVARRAARLVGPTGRVVGVDPNPGMLAVARSAAAAEGVAIEWREGRAESLPVENAVFDLVCCQVALMFFEDRPAALREMRRVLAPRGRIAVSVAQGIESQPPLYAALDEIIVRHLGIPILARTVFSLGDADELRTLLEGAGFHGVVVEPFAVTARIPDPAGFLRLELGGAIEFGAAAALAGMDPVARAATLEAVQAEAEAAIRPYVERGTLVISPRTNVALARVSSVA
jgi:ubiquinone/menaquinone biosynthesis C-methylase UbiE